MSVDKKTDHTPRDTLALIADKLSIVRPDAPEPVADGVAAEIPRLPAAAQLETPPVSPEAAALEAELADDSLGPLPPPVPPAPPPPRIDPFITMAPVEPPKPVSASLAAAAQSPTAVPTAASPAMAPAAPPPPAKRGVGTLIAILSSILIALLALGLAIYQGMLFRDSVEAIQRNAARGEFAGACRDIIGAYVQIKPRIGALMPTPDRSNVAGASRISETNRLEAQAAIARFAGLGTYLANFQDAGTRARNAELTKLLTGIYDSARTTPLAEIDRVFAPADRLFNQINDDCARLSRSIGL